MHISLKIVFFCLVMIVPAFILKQSVFPDISYTWFKPAVILVHAFFEEWFPSKAAFALILGLMVHKRTVSPSKVVSIFLEAARTPKFHAIFMSLVLFLGFCILPRVSSYNVFDWISICTGVLVVSTLAPPIEGAGKVLFNILVSVAMLECSSFVFTVIKAALFVIHEPLDQSLVDFEMDLFGMLPHLEVVHAVKDIPWIVSFMDRIYYSFFQSVVFVSLMLWISEDDEGMELIEIVVLTYLLGGLSYHLFPAYGPVYFQAEEYQFLRELPLISNRFQPWLFSNITEAHNGTLRVIPSFEFVACMPSLHMTHVTLIAFYCRRNKIAFTISLIFSVLTLFAIMILGWHYITDAFFGVLFALAVIYGWRFVKHCSIKREEARVEPASWKQRMDGLRERLKNSFEALEKRVGQKADS